MAGFGPNTIELVVMCLLIMSYASRKTANTWLRGVYAPSGEAGIRPGVYAGSMSRVVVILSARFTGLLSVQQERAA